MFLTAVRQEVNNLESSVVVQELESTSTFLKERHVKTILNDSMVRNAEGHGPVSWHYGAKTMCITSSSPA